LAVPRIVTLLAAATEIVAAMGAGDELVGVSHECDYPPGAVAGRPVLTTARVGPLASSAGVDRSVRQLVADALAVYDIDVELLAALAPDVIVTQDLCRVCAVSVDDVRAAVARLAAKTDITLVSLHPRRLGDILGDIARWPTRSAARPLVSGWWPGCGIGSSRSGRWPAGHHAALGWSPWSGSSR